LHFAVFHEEIYGLCGSTITVSVVKSRSQWAEHGIGETRICKKSWWRKLLEWGHLEKQEEDGRIILK
jgi:hypothetical protein